MQKDKHATILLAQEQSFETFLEYSLVKCQEFSQKYTKHLNLHEYSYSTDDAVKELGLDAELISELVKEYILQIFNSRELFLEYVTRLKDAKEQNEELDYKPLRELAHKNLGVARNLRIKSAENILTELMKNDDLADLQVCIEALFFCTIALIPEYSYNVLKQF